MEAILSSTVQAIGTMLGLCFLGNIYDVKFILYCYFNRSELSV